MSQLHQHVTSDLKALLNKTPKALKATKDAQPKWVRKAVRPRTLRATITPGTVLILLNGRFRGKRVVFLKQLDSGLLLVTGPFKVNGVPLRRVDQSYVIATTTKVDISSVKAADHINDEYFKYEKAPKAKGTEKEFFGEEQKPRQLKEQRVTDQKNVDAELLPIIKKEEHLFSYLNASFQLNKGQAPHTLKF